MTYKRGAFVAGQLSIVVKAGKDAEKLLRACIPLTEDEKASLRRRVETGREFEKLLEEHRRRYGF